MDDAQAMRGAERARDPRDEHGRCGDGKGTDGEPLVERHARQPLHCEIHAIGIDLPVRDVANDAGVIDFARSAASRTKRALANAPSTILRATRALVCRSRARKTVPIPPRPATLSISNRSATTVPDHREQPTRCRPSGRNAKRRARRHVNFERSMDDSHQASAEKVRSLIECGAHNPGMFRAALFERPADEAHGWLDVVLGLGDLPSDGPELPRGCVPYVPNSARCSAADRRTCSRACIGHFRRCRLGARTRRGPGAPAHGGRGDRAGKLVAAHQRRSRSRGTLAPFAHVVC